MSRRVDLPSTEQIQAAIATIAAGTGRPPSALAVATHLGLTNATFWRHFPDHAATIAEQRRRQRADPGLTALDKLRTECSPSAPHQPGTHCGTDHRSGTDSTTYHT